MIPIENCEPYFEYMRKHVEVDFEMMELIASQLTNASFHPKDIIIREGGVCNRIYFFISGTARSYYTDSSGLTVTWAFHFNSDQSVVRNVFATDYRSFLTNKPATITIEALSETSALVFSREAINQLMEKSLKYEVWQRKINEKAFVTMFERTFTLLTMSAKERYSKLVNDESHLMQMFSNYYIASYLGIAPQSLSRIRNQH
jgi:CRP-like cAMP-binding protein